MTKLQYDTISGIAQEVEAEEILDCLCELYTLRSFQASDNGKPGPSDYWMGLGDIMNQAASQTAILKLRGIHIRVR